MQALCLPLGASVSLLVMCINLHLFIFRECYLDLNIYFFSSLFLRLDAAALRGLHGQ